MPIRFKTFKNKSKAASKIQLCGYHGLMPPYAIYLFTC